ncbi:TerB family tellurite resistance protein [Beggiatoa leptomitoformis]|uniref:Co-chaperone DjlA N-terminal domain-containing protein n=1 Tax=Beggiatoa leptomitoformis TaxID=288004 RepID=A0A2N9YA47_9GAMM|nr:TerB family tellurite resistance protein [Beggiatoa leptomitoformis]ALG67248.1 hypothetical protein AL038_05440 [Beggiatoa leptomitoformis]AUI67329.1 hypothetical protein BLE401_00540 [Beggiatoa leptomitoformis]
MFGFLGFGNLISGLGGLAVGAAVMALIYKYTTARTLDKLEERLGGADLATQDRIIRKIAILKVLACRDGNFSDVERVFIYRYIMNCKELAADVKVALALDLDEPPPASFSVVLERLRALVSFSDLFISQEEAIGFAWLMKNLANADGSFDKEEAEYIQKICKDCKIPSNVIPNENELLLLSPEFAG